ncbi:uncharacterized protein LOC143511601 [Brachyhypopomus gauderio]|uniref:uncharacterized protein LOC143511601 n=1 Tax=Brachyhypopomus gauderio TaxID=698409 RepID=UPI0040425140
MAQEVITKGQYMGLDMGMDMDLDMGLDMDLVMGLDMGLDLGLDLGLDMDLDVGIGVDPGLGSGRDMGLDKCSGNCLHIGNTESIVGAAQAVTLIRERMEMENVCSLNLHPAHF